MLFLACAGALAPTRRVALRHAAGAAALSLTTAQRAAAATNAEAEKVRVASRELNELLKNEDALRFKVLVEGSGTDSASVASPPPARHQRDSRCRARRQKAGLVATPLSKALFFISSMVVSDLKF